MKIIAVNIHNKLAEGMSTMAATQRAWIFNLNNLLNDLPDFVIGVAAGNVKGYFKLLSVGPDILPGRVIFTLRNCTPAEIIIINSAILGENLKYFVTKIIVV